MGDNCQATGTGIGDGIGKWEMGKNLKSETCRFQLHWYHPTGVESSNEMGNGKWEMGIGIEIESPRR